MKKFFKNITGFTPFSFQERVSESILRGKSVILRAPTGSGKSEAVLAPFLYLNQTLERKKFPSQMIYSLPMKALVNQIGERFKRYCKKTKLKLAIHHGESPESELFQEDIVVTTIDQTVGAYCCTPLSMSLRSGNIPAGSVASSFLAFDEIHTYHPEFALQSVLNILIHSAAFNLPFTVLSATLPDAFLDFFQNCEDFQNVPIEIIDVEDEKEIISRIKRKVRLVPELNFSLNGYVAKTTLPRDQKIIIVCNTVKRAQEIFATLHEKYKNIFLAHSQFTPQHRAKKESKILEIFGKDTKENAGILVSTQVIEVGMDISCDLMISETAPIDSLIQRAGRVARWSGEGKLVVVGVDKSVKNPFAPYPKKTHQLTLKELSRLKNGVELDWNLEKELVNKILGTTFQDYLEGSKRSEILNTLSSAAFEGSKKLAEFSVRGESLTCQLSIHKDPESLGNKIFNLPRINISFLKLKKFFEEIFENNPSPEEGIIWQVQEQNILDSQFIDEKESRFQLTPAEEIEPYKFYIISSEFVEYSQEKGLIMHKGKAEDFMPILNTKMNKEDKDMKFHREFWKDHALNTLRIFRQKFLEPNRYIFQKLGKAWNISEREIVKHLELAILLHDIGKLNILWQKKIYKIEGESWDNSKPAMAHSSKKGFIGVPHAIISAEIMKKLINTHLPKDFIRVIIYTIAHHHAPRSYRFEGKFQLIENWQKELEYVKLHIENIREMEPKGRINLYSFPNLGTNYGIPYRTYTIFSKLLRLSDRMASGHKNL